MVAGYGRGRGATVALCSRAVHPGLLLAVGPGRFWMECALRAVQNVASGGGPEWKDCIIVDHCRLALALAIPCVRTSHRIALSRNAEPENEPLLSHNNASEPSHQQQDILWSLKIGLDSELVFGRVGRAVLFVMISAAMFLPVLWAPTLYELMQRSIH
jgi:hypothetical protein